VSEKQHATTFPVSGLVAITLISVGSLKPS